VLSLLYYCGTLNNFYTNYSTVSQRRKFNWSKFVSSLLWKYTKIQFRTSDCNVCRIRATIRLELHRAGIVDIVKGGKQFREIPFCRDISSGIPVHSEKLSTIDATCFGKLFEAVNSIKIMRWIIWSLFMMLQRENVCNILYSTWYMTRLCKINFLFDSAKNHSTPYKIYIKFTRIMCIFSSLFNVEKMYVYVKIY